MSLPEAGTAVGKDYRPATTPALLRLQRLDLSRDGFGICQMLRRHLARPNLPTTLYRSRRATGSHPNPVDIVVPTICECEAHEAGRVMTSEPDLVLTGLGLTRSRVPRSNSGVSSHGEMIFGGLRLEVRKQERKVLRKAGQG